jgi:hypothetical protein
MRKNRKELPQIAASAIKRKILATSMDCLISS